MKKLLLLFASILVAISSTKADDRIVDNKQLPAAAQRFIEENYRGDKISVVTMDRSILDKDYTAILVSGIKLEFDGKGQWSKLEAKRGGQVPQSVVPAKIASYVKARFPKNKIVKIERDSREFELELDNKIELTFNSKGDIKEIDH